MRGPKYVVKKGKTPVLTAEEARMLLDSIEIVKITAGKDDLDDVGSKCFHHSVELSGHGPGRLSIRS